VVLTPDTHAALRRAQAYLQDLPPEGVVELVDLVQQLRGCRAFEEPLLFARAMMDLLSSPGLTPEQKRGAAELRAIGFAFIAEALQGLCRLGEAEEAARQGLAFVDESHHTTHGELLGLLAGIKRDQGKLQEALECARRGGREMALAIQHGQASVDSAGKYFIIEADILERMGRVEEAMEIDAIISQGIRTTHRPTWGARVRIALALLQRCDYEGAEGALLELSAAHLEGGDRLLTSLDGPGVLMRAAELKIGLLKRKGTPDALQEARELEGALERMREALEARRRAALEEARDSVLQGREERRGERRTRRKKRRGKGGKRKGKGKGTGEIGLGGVTEGVARLDVGEEAAGGGGAVVDEPSVAAAVQQGAASTGEEGLESGVAGQGGKEEEEECAICLTALEDNQEEDDEADAFMDMATLGCGHRFHEQCIDSWVVSLARQKLDAECPYCRRPLNRRHQRYN
jgi:hypothetical protein